MPVPQLTIQHFPKTSEGQSLIANQKPFILGGKVYQGYKETLIEVKEKQLSDQELADAYDVDSSIEQVMFERRARLGSRDYRKNQELAERRAIARAKERDELELIKLRRELGADAHIEAAPQVEQPEPTASKEAPKPLTASQAAYKCDICGGVQPIESKCSGKRWLASHKMGKHRNPKAKHGNK